MNTSDISKALGQQRMADALDVGLTAVNNAVTRGYFPSSWFFVVEHLAKEAGVECPRHLFRMKSVGEKTSQAQSSENGDPVIEVRHAR